MEGFEELDDDIFTALPDEMISGKSVSSHSGGSDVGQPAEATTNGSCEKAHKDCIPIPDDFLFPFDPYNIQRDFMRSLFLALEEKKVGIFESPTGTGKSLSLICGALTWLRHHEEEERKELEELLSTTTNNIKEEFSIREERGLDWIQAFAQKQAIEENTKKIKAEQELRAKREERLKNLRNRIKPRHKIRQTKLDKDFEELFKDAPEDIRKRLEAELAEDSQNHGNQLDDDLVLDEYESDNEGSKLNSDEDEDEINITKIFYCSRTHSQLCQFVREVQKSPFGPDTQVISLASRQNLCINQQVKKLPSVGLINDQCLELQRNKSDSRRKKDSLEPTTKRKRGLGSCPYYKADKLNDLTEKILVDVLDIEQLVVTGRKTKSCPYYASRHAVPSAQLVVLPYQMLLHRATRASLGIKLEGSVVIIDEAHNLVETISNIHSVEVTGAQLTCAHSQLSQYEERYRSRLKAKNLLYIRQLLHIMASLIKALGGRLDQPADKQSLPKADTRLQTINDFLFDTQLDNINLFKVMRYCERSKVSRKLNGFAEKYNPQVKTQGEKKEESRSSWGLSRFLQEINQTQSPQPVTSDPVEPEARRSLSSPLVFVEAFLEALTNADKDGRVAVSKQDLLSRCSLRFLLLNPAVHFTEILTEARCVIVAGGTMQPLSEFKEQLFKEAQVSNNQILEFSCGHVIPPDHLLPLTLTRGPSGLELDFTYQSRETPQMMDELGRVVYNVCNVTPGGVVCFFPSYDLERVVYEHWEKAKFIEKIAVKKKIFREPKKANQVEKVLEEYTNCIKRHRGGEAGNMTGAVLLCVVGGKMSEGINFSDELGRCVIVVGLPYPNIRSPELKEKMNYLNSTMSRGPDGKQPGQIHYENLCMKAVNQSIGRAIRHRGDYASILLLDQRYQRASVVNKLPSWIRGQLVKMDRFGPAIAAIRKFFVDRAKTPVVVIDS